MGYKLNGIYVGARQVRPAPIKQSFVIDNIPTTDTNEYINVAKSGYTIQSVKAYLTCTGVNTYFSISSNNSNTKRYGIATGWENPFTTGNYCLIRGRLNGLDTGFRSVPYNPNSVNTIEFYINRYGDGYISVNGVKTTYTAGSGELDIIRTIMNLSDMNCYAAQDGNLITGDSVDVEVTYI